MLKDKDKYRNINSPYHKANNYINSAYPSDWLLRRCRVLQREHSTCQYCGREGSNMHVHHMIPISEGGGHNLTNLACACPKCHSILHPHNTKLSLLHEIDLLERYNYDIFVNSFFGILVDVETTIDDDPSFLEEGFHYIEDNIVPKM